MKRVFFIMALLGLGTMLVMSPVTGCEDDQSCESQTFNTDTQDVPFLGWYLIGMLGAARRRRHQLNNNQYQPTSILLN